MCSSLLIAGAVLHGVTTLPSGGRLGERGGLGSACAQLHTGWVTNGAAREFIAGVNATDEAVEMTGWVDPVTQIPYVYTCGFVKNAGGHTAMFVSRYRADTGEPIPGGAKFYPDVLGGPINVTGEHHATGITVDPGTGDIYVCGESKPLGQDSEFVVLQYGSDLVRGGGVAAWPNDGVVVYDHGSGKDRPEDIGIFGSAAEGNKGDVIVTGTTTGSDGSTDITSIRLDVATGAFSDLWPFDPLLGAIGVRTYPDGAADSWAAEHATLGVFVPSESHPSMVLYVAGTLRAIGADKNVLTYKIEHLAGDIMYARTYNGPEGKDDVATGIATDSDADGNGSMIAVCGHTVGPPPETPNPGGWPNTDYLALLYDASELADLWTPQGRIWVPGTIGARSDDRALDVNIVVAPALPPEPVYIWLTGEAFSGLENDSDVGTVVFEGTFQTSGLVASSKDGDPAFNDRGFAIIDGVAGATLLTYDGTQSFAALVYDFDALAGTLGVNYASSRTWGSPAAGRAMYIDTLDIGPGGIYMSGVARFLGSGTGYDATTVRFAD